MTSGNNGPITNFEKWRIFTDGLTSPDSFVNFGYYFLIASTLQRRVWLPPSHKPVFPNLYVVLIAPPGIGKGLVITEVAKMLKFHRKESPYEKNRQATEAADKKDGTVSADRATAEACAIADYEAARAEDDRPSSANIQRSRKQQENYEKPLLFPIAADATSYEALVMAISGSLRRKNYAELDPISGATLTKIYTHSSMCFCLEELSSLFRKKAEDVVRFLQITFDCGDYKKDTKTQGTDRIKNCCVSMLGGATQEFMQRLFKDELADEGFASRSIFIYEPKDRKTAAFIPELNDYQKQCEKDIQAHIKKLSDLYGQMVVSPDAYKFIEEWHQRAQIERPNTSDKLRHYYARKKIHLMKLAMAVHFSEHLDMTLTVQDVITALSLLDNIEKRMHYALIHTTNNPFYKVGIRLVDYLKSYGPKTRSELVAAMWEYLPSNEPLKALDQTIEYCQMTNKINNLTKDNKIHFCAIKESGDDTPTITKESLRSSMSSFASEEESPLIAP